MHVSELDTPALVVDLDVLDMNLREMAEYCRDHNLRLRPHIKTHKSPFIARKQLDSGACGITVAKLGEAEMMAQAGLDDILVAYPIVGTAKLNRLVELARRVRLTVATDSLQVAQGISQAAAAGEVTVRMLAEMDAGLRRCGVQSAAELVELSLEMARLPNVDFAGFMFFPGHVRVPPGQQAPYLQEIDATLQEARDKLEHAGVRVHEVSGGSTPTAYRTHLMNNVTEIRPGTYVFNDVNTTTMGATDLAHCALTVHTTVVSHAVKGRAVVDAGSKTIASDPCIKKEHTGIGHVLDCPGVFLESMSEEHGHLNIDQAGRALAIGDRLRIIPNHVCTAVNLHDEVWGVRNDEVVEHWRVEGRGLVR
jgi:D-serine deaminase-like pyridoxal phosphate-dependent protein